MLRREDDSIESEADLKTKLRIMWTFRQLNMKHEFQLYVSMQDKYLFK